MDEPRIEVLTDGPYRVTGDIAIAGVDGIVLRRGGIWHLCRCGGSRSKPFCDATHGLKGWDGTESASHDTTQERSDDYPAQTVTVHDDRARCAHFGQCTDRLPEVFRAGEEPFVETDTARDEDIVEVVRGCPSGALAFTPIGAKETDEISGGPAVSPIADGPYRVVGGVRVVAADGTSYEIRQRQTLCRCGQSANKPFCDGSHFYAGFLDPVPVEERVAVPTVYERLGGMAALLALTTAFYQGILGEPDPILEPLFRGMDPDHPAHVAAWLGETFGGPRSYTEDHGGYEHMVAAHRNQGLSEQQRARWVARLIDTADQVGLTADLDVRSAFVAYLEWGSRIALINSAPGAGVIEHAPVPRWGWGETTPYVPAPWDDPDAAQRGRDSARRGIHSGAPDHNPAGRLDAGPDVATT